MRALRDIKTFAIISGAGLMVFASVPVAFGYVASSSSYRIQSDSVNIGGNLSNSPSYQTQDTIGEDMSGTSGSASYNLKAGYQQMLGGFIAVTPPGNITLAPTIPSIGGGTSNGQAIWTITTDNSAGYSATLQSSLTPALQSGINNFANYTPGGASPDFAFSIAAAAAEFAFSPEGSDIDQRYKDNGANCNAGASDTADACWDPLLTTPVTVALRTSSNNPAGTALTLKFRAQSGASNTQPAGSYTATATLTVLAR